MKPKALANCSKMLNQQIIHDLDKHFKQLNIQLIHSRQVSRKRLKFRDLYSGIL